MTTHEPSVSVIVPAYNAEAFLAEALDSLLAQTLTDIEVLVVDDGSTDSTGVIASGYAERDTRVRVIRRQISSGKPSCARNDGIREARGAIIALLDADDISMPERLEVQLAAMRLTGASLSFADFQKFNGVRPGPVPDKGFLTETGFTSRAAVHLSEAGNHVYLCRPSILAYMLADAISVNVPTVMFRREVMPQGEAFFEESYTGGEDLDLFYRLAARAPFVYIDEVHTLVRVHPASLTVLQEERCMIEAANVRLLNLQRFQHLLDEAQVDAARRTVASWFFDIGYFRWIHGNKSAARGAFIESWRAKRSTRAVFSYLKAFLPNKLLNASGQRGHS